MSTALESGDSSYDCILPNLNNYAPSACWQFPRQFHGATTDTSSSLILPPQGRTLLVTSERDLVYCLAPPEQTKCLSPGLGPSHSSTLISPRLKAESEITSRPSPATCATPVSPQDLSYFSHSTTFLCSIKDMDKSLDDVGIVSALVLDTRRSTRRW